MGVRERLEVSLDCRLEIFDAVSVRELHGCLHEGQQVLRTMVHLARTSFAFFRLLVFGDILKAVDGADDVPIAILDRLDVNERDAARAVQLLDVDFLSAHRNTRRSLGLCNFAHSWERRRRRTTERISVIRDG